MAYVRLQRPIVCVLENVKELLEKEASEGASCSESKHSDKGKHSDQSGPMSDIDFILVELRSLGYFAEAFTKNIKTIFKNNRQFRFKKI